MKKIFMIAGEESGDNLGSKLINEIKGKNQRVEFIGVGGSRMISAGLKPIFPMKEINLMGFLEVVPHLPNLLKRINDTVERIMLEKPDVIVTIDSPGFNYQVAKKLKALGSPIKRIHYVAPSVWAYKPGRAKKTAALFDHLICLLPWEPKYFEKEGMKASFVGHPIFEDLTFLSDAEKVALKNKYGIADGEKLVAILPGSRTGEIKRLAPIFFDAAKMIRNKLPQTKFIVLPTEGLRANIENYLKQTSGFNIVSNNDEKRRILQICDAAITKSGTVALEVPALGCPAVVGYRSSELTFRIIKHLAKIPYANLVNISANKEIIKELIQDKCTSKNISDEIIKLLNSPKTAKWQLEEASHELKDMGLGSSEMASKKAAELVVGYL